MKTCKFMDARQASIITQGTEAVARVWDQRYDFVQMQGRVQWHERVGRKEAMGARAPVGRLDEKPLVADMIELTRQYRPPAPETIVPMDRMPVMH